ncbi:MAG: hypothetical protein LBJ74_01655 [Heliobacteriaceae bacterium]|jgi:septum site-determining protein MinC|nr:hypothetical protein [Heliobacteriaceae bacterium]
MKAGFVENSFIVDVSNARKTSEIIYELSSVLEDVKGKNVRLKLGEIDINISQLTSIRALIECMNSKLEFITTTSDETRASANSLEIPVSEIENKVPTPEFGADPVQSNKELELALDKIFGSEDFEEYDSKDYKYADIEEMQYINEDETGQDPYADFNKQIANANNVQVEDITEEIKEQLKETEKLPTLYIQRTIRSGQSINSDGNLVIIGDVHPGSEIIAKGDITVWGVLGGIAQAGTGLTSAEGNRYARIRALKMNAIQLRIADVFARRPDSANIPYIQKTDTFTPEVARVRDKHIIIQRIYEN